jgi:ribosomal protein L17
MKIANFATDLIRLDRETFNRPTARALRQRVSRLVAFMKEGFLKGMKQEAASLSKGREKTAHLKLSADIRPSHLLKSLCGKSLRSGADGRRLV